MIYCAALPCGAANGPFRADIAYGPDERQKLDVYQPSETAGRSPVVVFFYGGMWRNGHKKEFGFVGQSLAARGIATVIPDYRLYPDNKFPDFMEDAVSVMTWCRIHAAEFGGDATKIYVMGYANGAYMAALLVLDPRYLKTAGLQPADVAGMIGIAGLYRIDPSHPDIADVFPDVQDPDTIQPLRVVTGRNPPMLLLVGSNDDKTVQEDSEMLNRAIQERGGHSRMILYPNLGHIGIMLPFSPIYHGNVTVLDDVVSFMKPATP